MVKTAISRFTCTDVEAQVDQEVVSLHTVYTENDPEDTKFSKYTPWGNMKFGVSNPNLVGMFVPGKKYKVTITEEE